MSIQLSNVSKSFGADNVVDGVCLDIEAGAFFVVLGPSGCGKTTLLRMIAGLEPIDAGTIAIGGRQVADDGLHLPPEDRNVGFVFQSYALWPHMTIEANVGFPLEARGGNRREIGERVADCLRTVELEAYALRKPAQLSGGQRQRVALARCLAQSAGTILMDEPLANLDPHLRASMEEELARFHRATGATTLYITHDQREAMALADRLAVMWEGRILQEAAPDDIYRRPANERVARFIGRSAILDGRVLEAKAGQAQVQVGDLRLAAECAADCAVGAARIVIRPEDVSLGAAEGALTATVERVAYRGGFWEADASVAGFGAPLVINSPQRLGVGETVPLTVERAWILPGD